MANSVERYYQKKQRRKKKVKFAFFSLLFVLMMLTIVILSVTVFFNAEEIIVEGNTHYTAEELLEKGGLSIGQNLFRLDKFDVIERMQELPYIKTVMIKRKLPNKLTVKIVENSPVVWLRTDAGVALLNEDYRVLELLDLPEEVLPDPPEVELDAPKEEELAAKDAEGEEQKEEKPSEDKPSKENLSEGNPTEETPANSQLENIPELTPLKAVAPEVGKIVDFGEEADYTDFLKCLYEAFSRDADMQWNLVDQVHFAARYDIKVIYSKRIIIDFGSLDRAETKVELAAYLLKDNSTAQEATLDVSDPERVYYRPHNK